MATAFEEVYADFLGKSEEFSDDLASPIALHFWNASREHCLDEAYEAVRQAISTHGRDFTSDNVLDAIFGLKEGGDAK